MFTLVDSFSDNVFVADSHKALEEIALSLYEEAIYEWYYAISQEEDTTFTLHSDLIFEAEKFAKAQLTNYPSEIKEAIFICD